MTPEQVRYTPEAHTTRGWKSLLMNNRLLRLAFISFLIAQATPSTVCAQTNAAPTLSGVIGKVQSVSASSLDIQTPSGVVDVHIAQRVTTYHQIPSDLSHVTSTCVPYHITCSDGSANEKLYGKKLSAKEIIREGRGIPCSIPSHR